MSNTKQQSKNATSYLILDNLVTKKQALIKEIKNSFIEGLKQACKDYPDIQAVVLYRFALPGSEELEFYNVLGFRPKKESKALMELAENFKFDRDLKYACIPMHIEKSETATLSTTKTYPKPKDVAAIIKNYENLYEYLNEIFHELDEELEVEFSVDNSMNANIYKIT